MVAKPPHEVTPKKKEHFVQMTPLRSLGTLEKNKSRLKERSENVIKQQYESCLAKQWHPSTTMGEVAKNQQSALRESAVFTDFILIFAWFERPDAAKKIAPGLRILFEPQKTSGPNVIQIG